MSSRPTTQPHFSTQLSLIVAFLLAAGVLIGCGSPDGNGAEDAQPGASPTTTAEGGGAQDGSEEDDGSDETETPGSDEPSTSNEVRLGPELGPSDMDFGVLLKVGLTSSKVLTVRNVRDTVQVFSAIEVSGTDASNFNTGGDCRVGIELAPNATCALTVTFAPETEGSSEAFLSVSAAPDSSGFSSGFSFRLVGRVGPPDAPTVTELEDVVTE